MKLKRLGALALASALTLSLATVSAFAAKFSDVPEGEWYYEHVTKMSNLGLAGGYPDGTFKPNGKMTAAECLLFCTRATGVDAATREKIVAARKADIEKLSGMVDWVAREIPVAVEANVITMAELGAMSKSGALLDTITRENICMYLVRAMQLEPLAKSLTTYPLSYGDSSQIAPTLQPYVYVLTNFGIVNGMDGNRFDPKGKVTRAQMTTMLSRAIDFMKTAGIQVELPEYTTYSWKAGTISAVAPASDGGLTLTLSNDFTGSQTYTLSAAARIIKDNMLTNSTDLKTGSYVRLNFSPSGAVTEARLGGPITTQTGTITEVSRNQISLTVNGVLKTFPIDRFTQVMSGAAVGGRELIDPSASHTTATCYVDSMGHLAGVKLTGGTRVVTGLIQSIGMANGVPEVGVAQPSGAVTRYPVLASTAVTVNGNAATLTSANVGQYITLRVSSDRNLPVTMEVDTTVTCYQGAIVRTGLVGSAKSLYLTDISTGRQLPHYVISPTAVITFDGKAITADQLESDWFATVRVEQDLITSIEAFPDTVTAEGTLNSITYAATTVLQVTDSVGVSAAYELDIAHLPSIIRDGKKSSVDQLRTGDKLLITIRYNRITEVLATSQTANLTGTLSSVSRTMDGAMIGLLLDDGTTRTFATSPGVPVTQNGAVSNLNALQPGYTVALVTSGDTVLSIEITATASAATQITGTVYTISNSGNDKPITVLLSDASSPVTVKTRGANMMNISGTPITLSSFSSGDQVICYGHYQGALFVADIVILQK